MAVEDNADKGVSGNVASVESGSASLEGFFEPDGQRLWRLKISYGNGLCIGSIDFPTTELAKLRDTFNKAIAMDHEATRQEDQSRFVDIALPLLR